MIISLIISEKPRSKIKTPVCIEVQLLCKSRVEDRVAVLKILLEDLTF